MAGAIPRGSSYTSILQVKFEYLIMGQRREPPMLLCYQVRNIHCSSIDNNNEDFQALLKFREGITDTKGALNNWNHDTHFCQWYGVNCISALPYRVVDLNLTGQNLAGYISASLGNLTFLDTLDLSNNSFHGTIPPLHKLQHLTALYLGSNQLQGVVIPEALTNCSKLAYLDLSENNLTLRSKKENNLTGIISPRIGLFLTSLV